MTTPSQERFKYPRTPHLPWSPGATSDDVLSHDVDAFVGQEVVVTEKMDGENTTLYRDFIHARSIDGRYHPSRDWIKRRHAEIAHEIPNGWRVCGENLFAQHSIQYESLESYSYAFSVWDGANTCLSWRDTIAWFKKLNLSSVPVIYEGMWDEKRIKDIKLDLTKSEGYVLRLASSFQYDDFANCVRKWVRTDHVTSDAHWMHTELIPNRLKE